MNAKMVRKSLLINGIEISLSIVPVNIYENTIVEIIHAVLNNKHGDIIWIKIRRYL